jgi:glycosyltransferase involved in cell wall biosynthesis
MTCKIEHDTRMKILHISISDAKSGSSIAAYRLHTKMRSQGFDSKMLVLMKTKNDQDIVRVSNFSRYFISKIGLFLDKALNRKMKKEMGAFSFSIFGLNIINHNLVEWADVIYLHWINNGFLSIGSIEALAKTGKKILFFAHDMWSFTGGCHLSFGCEKYKTECKDCHFYYKKTCFDMVKYIFRKKKRLFSKYNNIQLLVPSTLFYRMVTSSLMFSKENIYHVPNLIDESKFRHLQEQEIENYYDIPKTKHIILYGAVGGKNNVYKGWDYFVEAINNIPESIKEKVVVVLFGYDFTDKELKELPFNAFSTGLIFDEERMINLYNYADVYVFPSLYESFGLTIYEAMACGTPVVAFNVGAVSDIVVHLTNGYIAEYKNSFDLAKGIISLLSDDKSEEMSYKARKAIEEKFCSDGILEKHKAIFGKQYSSPEK